ncbi:putative H(+)-transporting two-sector ATPase [Corynebacterium striatum]|nr:putative H(+)-transporting two-sector ATPase [Corynebacterium striatum]
MTALGFLLLILLGTFLLMLPISTAGPQWTPPLHALFTATPAVSLTGLIVQDTGTYWTSFGQVVIITLIQLGGLGIMSLASLSGMLLTGRISLKARRSTAAEGRPVDGGIRRTLRFTFLATFVCEAVVAIVVGMRLHLEHGVSGPRAVWEGIFHAISAFNNAGFSTYSDNMIGFSTDAWILLPLAFALITGGLGYPMLAEIARRIRGRVRLSVRGDAPRVHHMSITARMTFVATAMLLLGGMAFFLVAEWNGVLKDMSLGTKLLNGFFMSASPRTAGFNAIDYADAHTITLMFSDILMFIGGGSAGTAGGVKVTTACVLAAGMAAEFLGREDTTIGKRRLPHAVTRQALALTIAGVGVVMFGVASLVVLNPQFSTDQITFEVLSAFATVGLSTGITANLTAPSQIILCCIMYLGRVGPTTLVASLAARTITRHYRYPVERPFIG